MADIKMIAVDLDGTLLTSAAQLAPEGVRALRQAAQQGVHVVLATTRNPENVREWCVEMGIDDPIICTNGAQVWGSPHGPVWASYTIPLRAAQAMANLADEQGWELAITVGNITYWRQRPGQELGQASPHRCIVAAHSQALVGDPVRILTWQPKAVARLRALSQIEFADMCYSETFYSVQGIEDSLGVFPLNADKGRALELVCSKLGVEASLVMALGDNAVDLPMFICAGLRIAMGNAIESVKRAASVVAPTNDEEGVAWAVKKYVLSA